MCMSELHILKNTIQYAVFKNGLEALHKNEKDIFANVQFRIKIFCISPVTTPLPERSFSST